MWQLGPARCIGTGLDTTAGCGQAQARQHAPGPHQGGQGHVRQSESYSKQSRKHHCRVLLARTLAHMHAMTCNASVRLQPAGWPARAMLAQADGRHSQAVVAKHAQATPCPPRIAACILCRRKLSRLAACMPTNLQHSAAAARCNGGSIKHLTTRPPPL